MTDRSNELTIHVKVARKREGNMGVGLFFFFFFFFFASSHGYKPVTSDDTNIREWGITMDKGLAH